MDSVSNGDTSECLSETKEANASSFGGKDVVDLKNKAQSNSDNSELSSSESLESKKDAGKLESKTEEVPTEQSKTKEPSSDSDASSVNDQESKSKENGVHKKDEEQHNKDDTNIASEKSEQSNCNELQTPPISENPKSPIEKVSEAVCPAPKAASKDSAGKGTSSHNSKTDSKKGDLMEVDETVKSLRNHLSGGSIISSNDVDVSKSISIDDAVSMDVDEEPKSPSKDHSLNLNSNTDEQSKNKSESDNSQSSVVDLTESKSLDINPLEKLNEHIKLLGSELGPTSGTESQKSDSLSLNTSASNLVSDKSHSNASSNKENKGLDETVSKDRVPKESPDNFVFAELSNEETGFPDAFTGLVTIGKYISVKGDFTLRSTEALVESPSLVAPYLLKEPDTFPPKDKDSKSEVKDFFHCAAGEILIGIGLSRVNEWFHKDMARIKKRQMKRGGKTPELEEDLAMHEKCFTEAKKANHSYSFDFHTCKICGFTTESKIVLEGHLIVPHITARREYECSFCSFIHKDPRTMLDHMESKHQKIGRVQPPITLLECPYCTFESTSKVKLNNHLPKCQRYFDPGINLAPPKDFEFPALTPKPITVAVVKAYEKSLGSMQRGRGRPKKDLSESLHMNQFSPNSVMSPNQIPSFRASSNTPLSDALSMQNQILPPMHMPNLNLRPAHSSSVGLRPSISSLHMPPPNRYFPVGPGQMMSMMGNNHLVTSPSQFSLSSDKKSSHNAQYFNSMFGSGVRPQQNASNKNMPSVTITPLPKLQGPYPVPMAKQSSASGSTSMQSNSLVVCEICDGYIKDLEQLRTHMQLIHKVKIHPKMLVSRPPLNCQKCQWRFFTDQGLERHLLGAHGLVTSNMQELANKGKDAGCCTICGRVFASKLVGHMNQVHKVTLKPAHLSYKCTVCSATFNLYRLFENHVYLVHSGAAKRAAADGRSSPSKKLKAPAEGDAASSNHKDRKSSSKEPAEDENTKKCKECGKDTKSQSEKCEKCLKTDVQGTLVDSKTLKDELRNNDKAPTEKVA